MIQLRARDADGEVVCTTQEPFTVELEPQTDLYFQMICGGCFCAPAGEARVTVETLAEPELAGVQSGSRVWR